MKILSLNCQRGHRHTDLLRFFQENLQKKNFDFILLQEMPQETDDAFWERYSYKVLRHINKAGEQNEIGIVFNKTFDFVSSEFIDLDPGPVLQWVTKTFGALIAVFKTNSSFVVLCSLHLPAFLQVKTREKSLLLIKKRLTEISTHYPNAPIVGGGDFNTINKNERGTQRKILADKFQLINNNKPTYSSYHIEPSNLGNKLVWLLSRLGFNKNLTLDHIFTNNIVAVESLTILPVLVSDHKPLLLLCDFAKQKEEVRNL